MDTPKKTSTSIYVEEGAMRRFRALCALQGLTINEKIKQIVEDEAEFSGLAPVASSDAHVTEEV